MRRKILNIHTEEDAGKFITKFQEKFPKWYKLFFKENFEFTISTVGITQYWQEVGDVLQKSKVITAKRTLYDIHRVKEGRIKQVYLDLRKVDKLFSDVLEEAPDSFGQLLAKKPKGGINSKEENNNPFNSLKLIPLYREITKKKWLLFAFTEKKNFSNQNKSFFIHQSIIQFTEDEFEQGKKRWKIKLWAQVSDRDEEYNGYFGIRETSKGHIYLETFGLELFEKSKKHLRMMFYFGMYSISQLALGVFYNIRYHGALMAGSTLLVQVNEEDSEYNEMIEEKQYVKYFSSYNEIHKKYQDSIWPFFERKSMNYIKLPNLWNNYGNSDEFHTLKNLEIVVKKHQNKSRSREIWLTHYLGFISIPLTYQNNESIFNKNKKLALEVLHMFSKVLDFPEESFFFAAREHNLTQLKYDNEIPKKTIYSLERSKAFILILPKLDYLNTTKFQNKISSSFTELGYAMALKKNIFILAEKGNENILPNNIKLLEKQNFIYKLFYDRDELQIALSTNKDNIIRHLTASK